MSTVIATGAKIIVGMEMWLNNDISELLLNNTFKIFQKDCTQSRGGGVMLAVSRPLKASVINIESDVELVWARIQVVCITPIVGTCYHPQSYTDDFCSKLYECVEYITNKYGNAEIVLVLSL